MEPTSQEPQEVPQQAPTQDTTPPPAPVAPAPSVTPPTPEKRSKMTLILIVVALVVMLASAVSIWFWLQAQPKDTQTVNDQPTQNSQQQKAPEPNTVAYAFREGESNAPSDLFWRSADGGEKESAASKANVGSSLIHGNKILIETYGNGNDAPGILYSDNGGKTYTSIFTGKKPASATDFGDQITGMTFASDGKSVLFGLLPNNSKNTVKRVFFDKPNVTTDIMTSDAAGVFPIAFNAKTQKFIFSEGCYNCDGNGASTSAFMYDVTAKKRTTLIDGKNKHLSIQANRGATRLLIVAPKVDMNNTQDQGDGFWGYYVGAPFTLTVFDLETEKNIDPSFTVGSETDNKYVRSGFMADGNTPYYVVGSQIFMPGKGEPTLLYEAGKEIHEAFYVSMTTVFASVGTYEDYVLNRFDLKTKSMKQILTGDDSSTRIFGITEN